MAPVITSLLDTDLYKFTMWQALLHRHPQTQSEYRFVCRNQPIYPLAELLPEVNAALDHLCTLRFGEDELAYLGGLRFIKSDFIDFLRIFQFQRSFIRAWAEGDQLHIVAQGPQVHVMGFEIFVLAIVNELYFRRFDATAALASGRERLTVKVQQLQNLAQQATLRHPFELFDFGLRRRYSGAWQREVVKTFAEQAPQWFKGTSNVLLARDLGLVPIGTMAHEYLLPPPSHFIRNSLRSCSGLRQCLDGHQQQGRRWTRLHKASKSARFLSESAIGIELSRPASERLRMCHSSLTGAFAITDSPIST